VCTSPNHEDCLGSSSRREALKRLAALGLSVPLASATLDEVRACDEVTSLDRGELVNGLQALIARAKSPELVAWREISLTSDDLPWKDLGLTARKGQAVTFLLGGRIWLARQLDIWVEPGTSFFVRSRGQRPMYNPMSNSGTMLAAHDGALEIARALAEWKNEDGVLWTPEKDYKQVETNIYGIALVWRGDALRGLRSLLAHGDSGGVIGAEINRLESSRRLPQGWNNIFQGGGGPVIFNDLGGGEIGCRSFKNAGILQKTVSLELKPGTKLSWRWIIDELPSLLPENEFATHDYLSIGAEYDDGQDLTYIWSRGLPVGKSFRCPFPRWTPIETHLPIRSGLDGLGAWASEERDLYADYKEHVGGPAKKIVRIWLLGVTLIQRRQGSCRFADIQLSQPGQPTLRL
jgi:hypothetical protein